MRIPSMLLTLLCTALHFFINKMLAGKDYLYGEGGRDIIIGGRHASKGDGGRKEGRKRKEAQPTLQS